MSTLQGKFVWFELVTRDAAKAQAFYGEVLGWKVTAFPMGDSTYEMITAGAKTVGGYTSADKGRPRTGPRISRSRTSTPRSRASRPRAARSSSR